MDDLLTSIRKIIAEDYKGTGGTESTSETAVETPQPQPVEHESGDPDTTLAEKLMETAERSVLEALREPTVPAGQGESEADDEPRPSIGEPDINDAMHSIANAIAAGSASYYANEQSEAELEVTRRRQAARDEMRRRADRAAADTAAATEEAPPRESATAAAQALRTAARRSAMARADRADDDAAAARLTPIPPNEPTAAEAPHKCDRSSLMQDMAPDQREQDARLEGNVFRKTPGGAAQSRAPLGDGGLTSSRTKHNVSTSFDQLSRTILASNPRTLEDLVRDMLRPMLREWLDTNLPDIVERQVRNEIDRLIANER